MDEKTCSKCKRALPANTQFFRMRGAKLQGHCNECQRKYERDWLAKNREHMKQRYTRLTKEQRIAASNRFTKWQSSNKAKYTANILEYQKKRRDKDPSFRLRQNLSRHIRKSVHQPSQHGSWMRSIGYTGGDLRNHLERQFQKGMSWGNYGTKWHIDHIVPVHSFRLTDNGGHPDMDQIRACWALSNLRPLWAADNIKKRHQRTHLL